MPRETMTPRERWEAVFRRTRPDRVPMDHWSTPETDAKLMRHLGCATKREMLEKLHIDFVVKARPRYAGPALPPDMDAFGRRFRDVDYGTGVYRECVHSPLAAFRSVAEVQKYYIWPSPDRWDYSGLKDEVRGLEDYPVQGGDCEPFLIYKELRGQEQAYVDLIENPELVHYCLDRLFALAHEDARRIYEALPGRVMLTYVAEDMGGQTDLLFSVRHIEEFLLPGMKRMIDLAHEAGACVFHHNDGACWRIIPRLIEIGIDLLNPLQWRSAGMERERLKRDFGSKIVLHGGLDNQYTLPFGTVAEVRQEVLDNFRILGEGGGYILAPCHNIQAVSPVENILAMYETGYEHGWT